VRRKAFAYVTNRDRLLVFSHPNVPEAGTQVPAGTIEPHERPEDAVMREAREETGLERLRLVRFLGDDVRDRREDRGLDEIHHRYFFHLACDGDPPERWRRHEPDPSELAPDEPMPLFELFWAPLPDGVPELIAGHERLLRWLVELMGLAEYRPPARVTATPGPSLRQALAHVRFVGGPPDAGKSTVAQHLVDRHGLRRYTFDNWAPRHVARMDPARQPALHAFSLASMDERWVLRTPEEMAAEAVRLWTERFWMMVEDLLAPPREPAIVAEGPGLFPECVAQVIEEPCQAIWLLPTREFKLASAQRRDKPTIRHGTSDPDRAAERWLARDLLLGEHVRREVERLGLPSVVVDGGRSADQMADALERHFGLGDHRKAAS
jgi:ADP-ribose pyrophosphatase YjhB (NUDIX family)